MLEGSIGAENCEIPFFRVRERLKRANNRMLSPGHRDQASGSDVRQYMVTGYDQARCYEKPCPLTLLGVYS